MTSQRPFKKTTKIEDDPEYIEEDEARQSSLLTRDPLEIEGDDPLSDADE